MSTKGIELVSIHDEIVDGDTYLRVLEDSILPLMNPFPLEKSVLFNDNAPVHNKAAIMTLCQTHGVIAVFFFSLIATITIPLNLYFIVQNNTADLTFR